MHGRVYMEVPYAEKDVAKVMGAKWDSKRRKWYFEGPVRNYVKFANWIANGRELTRIASQYIFLIEGKQDCFKCKKPTRVIGLGFGEHISLFDYDDGSYEIEVIESYEGYEPTFLSWTSDEDNIPPALLRYLKKYYNVKTGYSRTAGECFANHCDHCGVIQGNWHLFHEDSALTAYIADGPELAEKLKKLKIYCIGIDEDLVLDWDFGYGDNDELYVKYAELIDLQLPEAKYEDVISYEELYDITS